MSAVKYLRVYKQGEPIALADVEFRVHSFPELDHVVSARDVGETLSGSNVKFNVGESYTIIVSNDEKPTFIGG